MLKKTCQCLLIVFMWLVALTGLSIADTMYVAGITEITMRTGPSVDNKIVAMLKTGTRLEIVEYQTDWSRVRTMDGKAGWVLTRFMTRNVPEALRVQELTEKNQALEARLMELEVENKALAAKSESLVDMEEKYNRLQKESADFLKLETRYKDLLKQHEVQQKEMEDLEASLNNEPKLWFLIGPGVFIVGLFFGLSTRKKRRSSLL